MLICQGDFLFFFIDSRMALTILLTSRNDYYLSLINQGGVEHAKMGMPLWVHL